MVKEPVDNVDGKQYLYDSLRGLTQEDQISSPTRLIVISRPAGPHAWDIKRIGTPREYPHASSCRILAARVQ